MTYRFAFILDQQVGLRTQALNFERVAGEDPSIDAAWVPVRYERDGGLLSRLPGVPSGIKGTLRGVREIRDGWRQAGCPDAALWATWAAKSVPDLVAAAPAFLAMDMTPTQMEAMGALYGYSRARARLGGGWKRRATERLYRRAAHLFPWNDWVAASLRDDYGVPPEKITPVFPGVDLALFRPDPTVRPDDGVVRLLFVGGDFHRKGGDLLLRWARETRVGTPWELHLVTRDPVPETPRVVVHRNVANNSPELARLYQQADLFALPTRADCFSLVAMEAMACGLPVVISRLGGIPELVRDGETGFLLEPDDYDGLAQRLDRLVADAALRRRLGAGALAEAQARFDCRANLARILSAMKEAVERNCGVCPRR
ncbi:MAG: glycosyltransferase family 4 protein [Armatimonadetes bacterium]|nr:glycosyltransferase family 4 protein [Armatimonadota bacterium]